MAIKTWSQMAALLPVLIVSSAIDGGVTWTPHFPRGHHRLNHGQGSSLIRRKHSRRLGKVARKMYGSRMPFPLKNTRQFRHCDL